MNKQSPINPAVVFILLIFVAGTILFLNCFHNYKKFDIDHDDVTHEQLTFISCDKKSYGKGGDLYNFYFTEHSEPLIVDSITSSALDKTALKELKENQKLDVCYIPDSKEICELKSASTTLLSLSDYVKENRNNEFLGMILIPILVFCTLIPIVAFNWFFNKTRPNPRNKEV